MIATDAYYQMSIQNRHDRDHQYGSVVFHLSNYRPEPEQCKFLMFKILESAVRDYRSLVASDLPNEKAAWELARDFLFDDEYRFTWGDWELSFIEFLSILDLDVHWVREQATRRFREQHGDKYDRDPT